MAVGELTIRLDTRLFQQAIDLFEQRWRPSEDDGFDKEFVALHDADRLYRVVRNGDSFSLEPTNEFELLLDEMDVMRSWT